MITELEMTRLDIEGEAGAVLSMNHETGLVSVELTRVQALHVKSYRSQQFSSVAGLVLSTSHPTIRDCHNYIYYNTEASKTLW